MEEEPGMDSSRYELQMELRAQINRLNNEAQFHRYEADRLEHLKKHYEERLATHEAGMKSLLDYEQEQREEKFAVPGNM